MQLRQSGEKLGEYITWQTWGCKTPQEVYRCNKWRCKFRSVKTDAEDWRENGTWWLWCWWSWLWGLNYFQPNSEQQLWQVNTDLGSIRFGHEIKVPQYFTFVFNKEKKKTDAGPRPRMWLHGCGWCMLLWFRGHLAWIKHLNWADKIRKLLRNLSCRFFWGGFWFFST